MLDSSTFQKPTHFRAEAFESLERGTIQIICDQAFVEKERKIHDMCGDADKLAEAVRHDIGVTEEGNSKAIFVFTLVTIVFLPLSFVSSVFGMNTVDVRDMESSQWLFWAIAIPVTAAVGATSLLAAYGGPVWAQSLKKAQTNGFVQSRLQRKERLRDLES